MIHYSSDKIGAIRLDDRMKVHYHGIVGGIPKMDVFNVVRDPGEGFDPKSVPSPVEGEQLYSAHGRGIYLINELMDEVRFEKGGSEIRMRKE